METAISSLPPWAQFFAYAVVGVAGGIAWLLARRAPKPEGGELQELRWQLAEKQMREDHALALEAARESLSVMVAECRKAGQEDNAELENVVRELDARIRKLEIDYSALNEAVRHGSTRRPRQ